MEELDAVTATLNRETSRINWSDLQTFYAQGMVIAVDPNMDLIEVAREVTEDNKARVQEWLDNGRIFHVDDLLAQSWLQQDLLVWTVVVAPWILVQERKSSGDVDTEGVN